MNLKLFAVVVSSSCILTGCVTADPPTVVVIDTPIIHPPMPRKLALKSVEWEIVNVTTNSYFALDAENYGNLSKNMSDVIGYIEKLRTVIQYYHHIRPDGTTNTAVTNTTTKVTAPVKSNSASTNSGNWVTRTFGGKPEPAPSK